MDALNIFADNGPVTPWQTISASFNVSTPSDYVLTFHTPSGAFGGPYLDNVRLDAAAVPEPSSLLIFSIGGTVALVGGWLRCRRRQQHELLALREHELRIRHGCNLGRPFLRSTAHYFVTGRKRT